MKAFGVLLFMLMLGVVLALLLLPITRSWGARVAATTAIKQDRWAIERTEHQKRVEALTAAVVAAGRAALYTLAVGVPVAVLVTLVMWARVAVQARIIQRLPRDRPVLIDRRIYDPRTTINLALDAAHEPSVVHAQALAIGGAREQPARARYLPVELTPNFTPNVLEVWHE